MNDADFLLGLEIYSPDSGRFLQENEEMREILLPIIRADFQLAEDYVLNESNIKPLSVPITTFYGEQDTTLKKEAILAWQQYSSIGFEHEGLAGDHFYLNDHAPIIVGKILARINQSCSYIWSSWFY